MNLQFSTPLIKSDTFTLSVSPSISTCLLFQCSALHSFKAGSATASTKQKVSPLYDHNYGQWQLSVIYIYPFIFWVLWYTVKLVQQFNNSVAVFPLFFLVCFYQNSHISQAFQFFVPIGHGTGLHLPSSMFIGQTSDKRSSPDLSADEQLACRWKKVKLFLMPLQGSLNQIKTTALSQDYIQMLFPPLVPSAVWLPARPGGPR